MDYLKALVELKIFLEKWGIAPGDWFLHTQYANRLEGYEMPVTKGHFNIIVNTQKVPWKVYKKQLWLDTYPPKNSLCFKDYLRYLKKTGFGFDLIPLPAANFNQFNKKFVRQYAIGKNQKIQYCTVAGHLVRQHYLLKKGLMKKKGSQQKIYHWLNAVYPQAAKKDKKLARDVARQIKEFDHAFHFGKMVLKQSKPGEVKGKGVYKGLVRGRARVISKLSQINKFKKGEILVCVSTAAKFTPVLSKVAAIVTEQGGVLSHAAITAREYKIPCVINARNATKIFKTCERVEVDAGKGIVRKLK